jgi:hypothetical protein
MTKIKHSDYYHICNPREYNENTGNVCFNINDLVKFDKDFLFNQTVDGVMYTIVLPKEWVRDHMIPFYAYRKTNEYSIKSGGMYVFYILKVEEILKFNN